eukprot:m.81731 g.81731  ORF g.81731 m.81731 type:complete len:162 (+) comp25444_c0_seq4:1364-1849(+)
MINKINTQVGTMHIELWSNHPFFPLFLDFCSFVFVVFVFGRLFFLLQCDLKKQMICFFGVELKGVQSASLLKMKQLDDRDCVCVDERETTQMQTEQTGPKVIRLFEKNKKCESTPRILRSKIIRGPVVNRAVCQTMQTELKKIIRLLATGLQNSRIRARVS